MSKTKKRKEELIAFNHGGTDFNVTPAIHSILTQVNKQCAFYYESHLKLQGKSKTIRSLENQREELEAKVDELNVMCSEKDSQIDYLKAQVE